MNIKVNNWYLILLAISSSVIIAYVFNQLLFTRDTYYNTFQNQLDSTRIDELIDNQLKYKWVGFLIIPLWLLVRNFLVGLCLQIGLLLGNAKLRFATTFKIALIADFIFLLPQIIKLGYFLIFKTDYTLTDVQQFYPLSALSLFKPENLSTLLIYPFQTFNVFEVLYWILLAEGIKQALNADINQGIKVVFYGYIPALVLWVICIMFITVSLNPAT